MVSAKQRFSEQWQSEWILWFTVDILSVASTLWPHLGLNILLTRDFF